MLQWLIGFPEFAEFSENSAPFRKNSNGNFVLIAKKFGYVYYDVHSVGFFFQER